MNDIQNVIRVIEMYIEEHSQRREYPPQPLQGGEFFGVACSARDSSPLEMAGKESAAALQGQRHN